MEQLIEKIAKSLVDSPDDVQVTSTNKDGLIVIKLKVAPDDMGKVIGKQGRIAKSIRTILKSMAIKNNKRVVLDIEK